MAKINAECPTCKTSLQVITAQRIVTEAAAIAGHVPLYGETQTYEVRELRGIDESGAWITGCPTRSLMAYVRIPRRGQSQFICRAKDIIARKDTILAERATRLAAARNL